MKEVNDIKYYSITEVSEKIGRTTDTIKNWYKYKEMSLEQGETLDYELPDPHTEIGRIGVRYFTEEDIIKLLAFKNNIRSGQMSRFNRTRWGERGKLIQERADIKEKLVAK